MYYRLLSTQHGVLQTSEGKQAEKHWNKLWRILQKLRFCLRHLSKLVGPKLWKPPRGATESSRKTLCPKYLLDCSGDEESRSMAQLVH